MAAARDGFSLNAAVACTARERRKLERLIRYVARPAIALERLSRDGDGLVVYALEHAFRDGTTRVCCTGMYECRGRQARIAPAILLHFRHPWRSDAGSDITHPRVITASARSGAPASSAFTACSPRMPATAASSGIDSHPVLAAGAAAYASESSPRDALLKAGALQNAILTSASFSIIATDEHGIIQLFNIGAERSKCDSH